MPESENEYKLNMKILEVILIIAYLSMSILLCGSDILIYAVNVILCYHLSFTGLVQLRDGLFQLFVGITISS